MDKYLVMFSDSHGGNREVDIDLPEKYSKEDIAKSIWPFISEEVKDRLLTCSSRGSLTPWQDQIKGYGYEIISCTLIS